MIANFKIWDCALLAVIKYKNITSAKLVDQVKNVIIEKRGTGIAPWLKMGHGGTLDDPATGVVVIGSGLGCKLMSRFLHGGKTYLVDGQLGIETDTLNECGKIVKESPYNHVTEQTLKDSFKQFKGLIWQTPPVYSALKKDGRRYSDLALEGTEVSVQPRKVQCKSIKLVQFNPPFFQLEVQCGGGFYVRSLIKDIGQAVGSCAHVIKLHRSKHGSVKEDEAVSTPFTYDLLLQNALLMRDRPDFRASLNRLRTARSPFVEKKNTIWIDPT